jgi:hypothetical protein
MAEAVSNEQVDVESREDLRVYIIAALYAMCVLWGVTQALSTNGALAMLGSVLFAVTTTGWCVADSRRRGRPLLSVLRMVMFFTWSVSVPIYLVASRGWRGLAYAVAHGIGIVITMWIGYVAALYCAFGSAAFSAAAQ